MARVLILTASVGEGHDAPARRLADELRTHGAEVVVEDGLQAMGWFVRAVNESAPRVVFFNRLALWLWDVTFFLFVRFPPGRALAQRALVRLGGPGLLRLVERSRPNVVVSVYPPCTEALGWLRRTGRLHVPAVAVVTDLAGMRYWAARGNDVHLITQPESEEEVRSVVGRDARVVCVRGLTDPRFYEPRSLEDARAALGLPRDGTLVLVSGGGWGVGDVVGAAGVALTVADHVACLCGRNEELLAAVPPGAQAVGFTDEMPDWLAAADVLVHSTAGLTVLEALMRGCAVISYGWGRGHIRPNNRALERFGLATVVRSRGELANAIRAALARGREPDLSFADLPSAASVVLDHAEHAA